MSLVRKAGFLLAGVVAMGAAALTGNPAEARTHTHLSIGVGVGSHYPAYRPYYGYPGYYGGGYYRDPFFRPPYYAPRPVIVTPYPTYYGAWDRPYYGRPYDDRPTIVTRPVERRVVTAAPADGIDRSYCREYQSSITVDGQEQPTFGTACKQPDGSWRLIN